MFHSYLKSHFQAFKNKIWKACVRALLNLIFSILKITSRARISTAFRMLFSLPGKYVLERLSLGSGCAQVPGALVHILEKLFFFANKR